MWVLTTPSEIGARAEAEVTAALVRAGRTIYLPAFSAHARVDLVYEDSTGLVRVQCKSASYSKNTLRFLTCSHTGNLPIS